MTQDDIMRLALASFAAVLPLTTPAVAGLKIKASNSPQTTGADEGPTLYLSFVSHHRYGWVRRDAYPDPDAEVGMIRREAQRYETTMQATALHRQGVTRTEPTAQDVANLAAAVVQSDAWMDLMRAQGVGILRVTDVRAPYFLNGEGEFEASPSFDFVLTHEQVTLTKVPEITGTAYRQYPV